MEQSNYYAILPASVRYDKNLSINAKLLYAEITSLSNKEGYCWATNEYFSSLYNNSDRTIQRWLKELVNKNYITIEIITNRYEDGTVKKTRKIYIINQDDKNVINQHDKFVVDQHDTNVAYNNINKNNINIYKYIVDYLNEKTNSKYKHTTPKTKSLINARLKEGFKVEDFEKVIDTKVNDWLEDSKMKNYLRPETLFGTKFEGYLNQSDSVSKKENHRRSF